MMINNVRKRLLEKPRFELAAKGVFRLEAFNKQNLKSHHLTLATPPHITGANHGIQRHTNFYHIDNLYLDSPKHMVGCRERK